MRYGGTIKAAALVLSVLIIAVLIAAEWRGTITTKAADVAQSNRDDGNELMPRWVSVPEPRDTERNDLLQLDGTASTQAAPGSPSVHAELEGHSAAIEQHRDPKSQVQASAVAAVLDDTVVGRGFPVSASIEASCRDYPDVCKREHELLQRMSEEPRDDAWGTATEEKLRRWVMAQPGFTVRALECRMSLCALEVASLFGMLRNPGHIVEFERGTELDGSGEGWATGYEKSARGVVTVTLKIFARDVPGH